MKFYKKWGLAIAVFILAVGITYALRAQQKPKEPPKSYTVTLSIDEWQSILRGLEAVKSAVKTSNMPANQATFISDSLLLTYQIEFNRQIQAQLNAEQKQKDSTKTKSK